MNDSDLGVEHGIIYLHLDGRQAAAHELHQLRGQVLRIENIPYSQSPPGRAVAKAEGGN